MANGSSAPREVMVERVVREASASIVYPELTRTNYNEWALMMEVNFEAQGLWEAIHTGKVERREDRLALAALLRAVPTEMRSSLAVKKMAKEAWEALRTMHMAVARVQEANTQKLLKEFENIAFKEGETVDDFAMRIFGLATSLRALGENIEEVRVVKKLLRIVPARYNQVACSIEMLLDLSTLTMEELVGRLHMAEDRYDVEQIIDKAGRLLLSEEDWEARRRFRQHGDSFGGQSQPKNR